MDHAAHLVGTAARRRLLGNRPARRGTRCRQSHFPSDRSDSIRAVPQGDHHSGVDLLGDDADDARAVGARSHRSLPEQSVRNKHGSACGGTIGAGRGVDGRGQCRRDGRRRSGCRHLAAVSPAEPPLAGVRGLVDRLSGAGDTVVDRPTAVAGQGLSAVSRLHRIVRHDDPVDVADRGAARYRQLDPVRLSRAGGGRRAGDSACCRDRDRLDRGRWHCGAGDALDAGPRPVDDHVVRRPRRPGRGVRRRSRRSVRGNRASVPRFRGRTSAQHSQTRAGHPNPVGTRPRSSAGPGSTAGFGSTADVASGRRASREAPDDGGDRADPGGADALDGAGMDGQARAARCVRGRAAVLARRRGLAHRPCLRLESRRFRRAARLDRARRTVRSADLGPDARRAVAGSRDHALGRPRCGAAHAARCHSRPRLGATTLRRRQAVDRLGRHPCGTGHQLRRRAQRPGPGGFAVHPTGVRPPRARRFAGAREGGRVRRGRGTRSGGRGGSGRRSTASVSGRRDLRGRCRSGRTCLRSVHGRCGSGAGGAGRARVDSSIERVAQQRCSPARSGRADAVGVGCSCCGPARRFGDGDRHTDESRDRLRSGGQSQLRVAGRRRAPPFAQRGARLSGVRGADRGRGVGRRDVDRVEFGVGRDSDRGQCARQRGRGRSGR